MNLLTLHLFLHTVRQAFYLISTFDHIHRKRIPVSLRDIFMQLRRQLQQLFRIAHQALLPLDIPHP